MSKTLTQFFLVGIVVIIAIRLFRFQEKIGGNVVDRTKAAVQGRDPQQFIVAAALTTVLGMIAVIGAQALRKVS